MKKAWTVNSSKVVHQDKWITVVQDSVVLPKGQNYTHTVVKFKGGVGIIPITEDGKIYIVGQYRYASSTYAWEITKGAVDGINTPLHNAKRELKEETGISAKKWTKLSLVHTLPGSTNDKVYLYVVQDLVKGQPSPEDTEDIELQLVSFEKFLKMVEKGDITDAASIAGVLLAKEKGFLG